MTRSADTPYPLPSEPGGSPLVSYLAEEFYALPETDAREELYRGLIIREPLPSFGHGAVAVRMASLLDAWVRPRNLGRVVDHSGFVLARHPDTVRGPDVAFVSRERLAAVRAVTLIDGTVFTVLDGNRVGGSVCVQAR